MQNLIMQTLLPLSTFCADTSSGLLCKCRFKSVIDDCLLRVQLNRIVKTQGGLMAEDRRALLAEQQASMERLVSLISASINRDLPLRMEEIVRAEVCLVVRANDTCC